MKTLHPEEALLLRDSAELDTAARSELEKALASDPALRELAESMALLQNAGRWASEQTAPPLADFTRARILQEAGRRPPRLLPRLLATAALLALGLGLWPHFAPQESPDTSNWVAQIPDEPAVEETLLADTEATSALDALQVRISELATLDFSKDIMTGHPEIWAAELLTLEESI